MLAISKPYLKTLESRVRLLYQVRVKDTPAQEIWFEFDKEYEAYITTERNDGVVVNFLLYAMERGYDIVSEQPISERLYYQLTNVLIPSISSRIPEYKSINIKADLDHAVLPSAGAVGTGISCGVDSFYTVLQNTNAKTKHFNLTHLLFFHAGSSGSKGGEQSRALHLERLNYVKGCAKELELPLIEIDTNVNELLQQLHQPTHTFRGLALILMMQKLFSYYYYASGVVYESFCIKYKDPSYYDIVNLPMLTTENTTFYSSGMQASRIGKTHEVSDFPLSYKYLNVCTLQLENCGQCPKCIRTIIQLYCLGKLDLYGEVFKLEEIYKNWGLYERKLYLDKDDEFMLETIKELKKRGEALSRKDILRLKLQIWREKLLPHSLNKWLTNSFLGGLYRRLMKR